MRLPVAIEAPIESWLLPTDDVDARRLAIEQLKEAILFASPDMVPEITTFLKSQSLEAALLADFINENVCFSNIGFSTAAHKLTQTAGSNGALIRSVSNDGFSKAKKLYFKPQVANLSPEEVFAKYFKTHLSTAVKITVVDCYAAVQLCDPNSAVSKLLKEVLLQQPGIFISIHSRQGFSESDLRRINPYELPKGELSQWVSSLSRKQQQEQLEAVFLDTLTSMLNLKETVAHRLEFFFHDYATFPHDRHVEVEIPSGVFKPGSDPASSGTISDYFALGNGFETFSTLNIAGQSARPSQIYNSDSSRMWTGKRSWFDKRTQWVAVEDIGAFKQSNTPLKFIKPESRRN